MTNFEPAVTRRHFTLGAMSMAAGLGSAGGLGAPRIARADPPAVDAFPGAEGAARHITGGRGGDVYLVSNLNDAGPGSLREAVSSGDRTIIFTVSGTIRLLSRLDITGDNLTIAGQTAPGDGICLADAPVRVAADNVIIRYLRCRLGDVGTPTGDDDAMWFRYVNDVMLDHCSLSWSIDEVLSPYSTNRLTVQWCLITESLLMSKHDKGVHGYGGIWGGNQATFHHNLIAHHYARNPRFSPGSRPEYPLTVDHRNNVVYNYGATSAMGGEAAVGINMIANHYRPGPNTLAEHVDTITRPTVSSLGGAGAWYLSDNLIEGFPEVSANNWLGVKGGVSVTQLSEPYPVANPPATESAEDAFEAVLQHAGAVLPRRDSVDARVIADVRKGSGRFVSRPSDVGGWPTLTSTAAPVDNDGDGIPDDWELAHGLDPTDPADGAISGPDGYTNLERYLNSITPNGAPNPSVDLLSPAADELIRIDGGPIQLVAEATGAGVEVAKVEFRAGDQLLGTTTTPPHVLDWLDAPAGTHHITATAFDVTGTSTTSTAQPVHVVAETDLRPWRHCDIGQPPLRGVAGEVGASLVVRGSGHLLADMPISL